jgi:hypothetical protein
MRSTPAVLAAIVVLGFAGASCRSSMDLGRSVSPCAEGRWSGLGSSSLALTLQLQVTPSCQNPPGTVRVEGSGTFQTDSAISVAVAGTQETLGLSFNFRSADSSTGGTFTGNFVRQDSVWGTITWYHRSGCCIVLGRPDTSFSLARQ